MPISWNEIRQNATAFSKRWATESRESAERQTFWNELFRAAHIIATGRSVGNMTLKVTGCCETLIERVKAKLKG